MSKQFTVSVDDITVTFQNKETNQTYTAVVCEPISLEKDKVEYVLSNSIYFKKMKQFTWTSTDSIEVEYRK